MVGWGQPIGSQPKSTNLGWKFALKRSVDDQGLLFRFTEQSEFGLQWIRSNSRNTGDKTWNE
jgi:hypothetical protein